MKPVWNRGIAIHIVIALFVSIVIMGTTYILGSSRTSAAAPLLVRLKADYHMESTFLLLQNRLRWQAPGFFTASTTLDVSRREIAPGVVLSSQGQQTGTASFRLESRVEGAGMQRVLVALLTYHPPAPGMSLLPKPEPASMSEQLASEADPVTTQPQGQWHLQYLLPERLGP